MFFKFPQWRKITFEFTLKPLALPVQIEVFIDSDSRDISLHRLVGCFLRSLPHLSSPGCGLFVVYDLWPCSQFYWYLILAYFATSTVFLLAVIRSLQSSSMSSAEHVLLVSSAYMFLRLYSKHRSKSFTYKMKSKGPRHDPWGIPYWTFFCCELDPLIWHYCILSVRYDVNH